MPKINNSKYDNTEDDKSNLARFTIAIPADINDGLIKYIPWGYKNKMLVELLSKILSDANELGGDGAIAIQDICNGNFSIQYDTVERLINPDDDLEDLDETDF